MGQLILLGTLGCHLCEEAEQLLAAHQELSIKSIDIADHPEWQARYALKIPVLLNTASGSELCWPFDANLLNQFLQRNRT